MSSETTPPELDMKAVETAHRVARALGRDFYGNLLIPRKFYDFDEALARTLRLHGQHIRCLGVQPTWVDPYKMICWIGFGVLNQIKEGGTEESGIRACADTLVRHLAGLFSIDCEELGLEIPTEMLVLLRRYVVQEVKDNPDHGIGPNGLYAAFHGAVVVARQFEVANEYATHPSPAKA